MTEHDFVVELAGRRWSLPHLPFRVIKTIQPLLFKVYEDASHSEASALSEAQIENLAAAAWRAIVHVDPMLTFEDFISLPFSVADLLATLPAVAQSAGLRAQLATQEASPGMGK